MPAAIKTARDEDLWREAKSAAARAGHPGDYAYIMGIFQRMKKSSPHGLTLGKSRGPFIGPRGGKWADAAHTIPWTEKKPDHRSAGKKTTGNLRGGHVGKYDHWEFPKDAFTSPPSADEFGKIKAALNLERIREDVEVMGGSRPNETMRSVLAEVETDARNAGISIKAPNKDPNSVDRWTALGFRLYEHLVDLNVNEPIIDMTHKQLLGHLAAPTQKSMVAVAAATAAARRTKTKTKDDWATKPRKPTLGQRLSAAVGRRPKGDGWSPVPSGKKGGFRRRVGGQWEYWYPGMAQPGSEKHAEAHLADSEAKKKKDEARKQARKLEGKGKKFQSRASGHRDRGEHDRARELTGRAHEHYDRARALRRKHGIGETEKSRRLVFDLIKAKPPGSGWGPIPGGRKGGFRRPTGSGFEYWYPGMGIQKQPHKDDAAAAKKKPKVAPGKPKPAQKQLPQATKTEPSLDVGKDREVITDPSALPEGFNDLPKAHRAVMTAHYDHVEEGMNERFGEASSYGGDIRKAMDAHVDELAKHGHIVPSNAQRAKEMFRAQYDLGIKAGLNKKLLADAMHENVRKVAHQEVEAARRTLGDHGVRHLAVNCEQASKVFDALDAGGVKITPLQRFMAYQVMVDHDMGYTISAIAQGGFAVKDNYHPQASTVMSFQQKEKLSKLFGGDEHFDQYVRGVANHSGSEVDWKADPFGSAIRLADNTHLFADKMPEVLFDSTAAVEALVKIRMAGILIPPTGTKTDSEGKTKKVRTPEEKAKFKALIAGVRSQLVAEIRKREDLPDGTRQNLIKAAGEIGEMTPKFLISRLAGRSPNFNFKNGSMDVVIEQSAARHTIGRVFGADEEDKQFMKLLKDYGTDPKKAMGAKPPPPHVKIGKNGGLNFRWEPGKDEHPAERRHAETMTRFRSEFDKIKTMSDGKEKDAAMSKFFGEVVKSVAEWMSLAKGNVSIDAQTGEPIRKSARIGSADYGLTEDERLAKMIEDDHLGVDRSTRHSSFGATGLRKSVDTLGGTIHQGELIEPGRGAQGSPTHQGDDRERYQRDQVLAQNQEFDGAGNRGCGGLPEWFRDSQDINDPDIQARVNVPLNYRGVAKSEAPPTVIIDTDDPALRAIHRTPTADSGARSDIDFVYNRDADR